MCLTVAVIVLARAPQSLAHAWQRPRRRLAEPLDSQLVLGTPGAPLHTAARTADPRPVPDSVAPSIKV